MDDATKRGTAHPVPLVSQAQFLQMAMHAMIFGLPLALMYAAAERRAQHVQRAHSHA